jgi:hypothetical protein
MKKRSIKIGDYDTAAHGWTLAGCKLSDPEPKLNYVEKNGGDGSWDLSTVLTGGITRYKNRTLTATLELSSGTREEREAEINELVNNHDGLERQIVLPDRPDHYLKGRVQIAVNYSDLAHAAVTVTATCEPWLYRARESIVELTATGAAQTAFIRNGGRRAVVPVLSVTGRIKLRFGAATTDLTAGTFGWPALLLTPGLHELEYSGSGDLVITYREAVLR